MADYVKLRTHVTGHVRFLEAGAVARDLYVWGMAWSGHQETDGAIPMAALLASPWGAGGKRNVVIAQKLVDVGLWSRTDTGFAICKWAEQGNVTKSELVEKRQSDRDRKARQRKRVSDDCPTVTPNGTHTGFPTSTSTCDSRSGSSGGAGGAPEWFGAAAATADMAGCPVKDLPARWVQFLGSCERRNLAPTQGLAASWLVSTIRAERREETRRPAAKPAEITKQPFDPEAPWIKLGDTGS